LLAELLFYVFAAVAIAASLLVIGQRSPIYSVLLLIASFAALAGLYVLLDAPFLAVIQIIIYAGAILVLFLFVVMLLNAPYEVPPGTAPSPPRYGPRRFGVVLAVSIAVELAWALWQWDRLGGESAATPSGAAEGVSSVREIGRVLFSTYAEARGAPHGPSEG
jgi:NADH-quinone oxidoreductase subunit J